MRKYITINSGWTFVGPDGASVPVDLPHTWNNLDGQDGGNDYWRGTCNYQIQFPKPTFASDERVYLEFRGVNASAVVGLNGQYVGSHDGGYSTFRWDVTDFLKEENVLTVHVNNSCNDWIYPQKLAQFRVDRMTVVEPLEQTAIPAQDFNPAVYVHQVFGMYGTDTQTVRLLCENSTMRSVVDRFGGSVQTEIVDEEHFQVCVDVAPSPPFFAWVFTFEGRIRITEPFKMAQKLKEMARWLY